MTYSTPFRFAVSRLTARGALSMLLLLMLGMLALSFGCAEQQADDVATLDAPRSQPAAYTQAYVQAAIDRYEADGLDETVDYYNSMESTIGQWYMVIIDREGYLLTHAVTPSNIGNYSPEGIGENGYPFGRMIADTKSEDGAWTDYLLNNPVGGLELKHTWTVVHDGLSFASGWYEAAPRRSDQPAFTQEYVRQAINLYEASGRDVLVDYYNDPVSVDGQWYMFIADESGRLIAHGASQDLVGVPLVDVIGANGYPSGRIVADDADEDGEWSVYTFFNPATGSSQTKHSWLVTHDGLIFGSGWYEDGPRKSEQPAYTQALVQQAMNLYDSSGLDATLNYYNDPVSVDGPWYVFVIDTESRRLSGHFNPEVRDSDAAQLSDSTGYFYGNDLLTATENGRWVDYRFLNPDTGEDSRKHTWAVLHDGYIFGSGWYE